MEAIEKELPPPSYTANTIAELRLRHPEHDFSLIVGADCLPDIPKWHDPSRLLELTSLIVVPRPGTPLWTAPELATAIGVSPTSVRMKIIDCPLMELASRDIRARVAEGKTIRYLVPRAVEEFIRERKMYSK